METILGSEIQIAAGPLLLNADLLVPPAARGMVVFVDGSAGSRHSAPNRTVAGELNESRMATLLVDLVTDDEERAERLGGRRPGGVERLTGRLLQVLDWLADDLTLSRLPVGLFAAGLGAVPALDVAAARPRTVRAVVSRAGRADLSTRLAGVIAPTLLIVGGEDRTLLPLNRHALLSLRCLKCLDIVAGVKELSEQPGGPEYIALLARRWFETHLVPQ